MWGSSRQYLKTHFLPDFLSSAPTYYLIFGKHLNKSRFTIFLTLKFLRIIKFVKYFSTANRVMKLPIFCSRALLVLSTFMIIIIWMASLGIVTNSPSELYYFINTSRYLRKTTREFSKACMF